MSTYMLYAEATTHMKLLFFYLTVEKNNSGIFIRVGIEGVVPNLDSAAQPRGRG